MNTKYILHGGDTSLAFINNVYFYRDIYYTAKLHTNCQESINILSVAHAVNVSYDIMDVVNTTLANDLANTFKFVNPHATFTVHPASFNTKQLISQIVDSDVVYVHGGDGDLLYDRLKNIGLCKLLHNKVCVGNSAGANIWSKAYYSNDNQAVNRGLDCNDKLTFCHYNASKWDKLNILIKSYPDNQVITLGDTEYIVL